MSEINITGNNEGISCWPGCKWIGNKEATDQQSPVFYKEFSLSQRPVSANLDICGLGYFEAYINTKPVTDSVLMPAQSYYDKTVYYLSFDVTGLLDKGSNTLGVLLGNGLYNCFDDMAWNWGTLPWRDKPKLLLKLTIQLDNTEIIQINSGPDFLTGLSPITYNMLYGGETADYTICDSIAYVNPSALKPASIVKGPGGVLRKMLPPYCTEGEKWIPLSQKIFDDGSVLYDFGQNIAGWVRINATAKERCVIRMVYAERLNENGFIDNGYVDVFVKKGRFATDEYIFDAEHPLKNARPHFVYHGFRYVLLTAVSGEYTDVSLEAILVHTEAMPRGHFICSDETLNTIQRMTIYSSLSNFQNIPTDCPQREKNGWTGDAGLSSEQMCINFDLREPFKRWLHDFSDSQRPSGQIPGVVPAYWGYNWGCGPAWDAALYSIPLSIYKYFNDSSALISSYPAMKKHLSYMESMADEYIVDFGLGDWCPPTGGSDGHDCPATVTDTAFYYHMAKTTAISAKLQGLCDENKQYHELAENIKSAFVKSFVDLETGWVSGKGQTSQATVLYFELLEGKAADKAFERLLDTVREKDDKLNFGILGAKFVFDVLSKRGFGSLAYKMITQPGFPSYRHWIDGGATTLLETWDGKASHNHHMFSDVSRWFYQCIAGLNPPDFEMQKIVFTPDFLPELSFAESEIDIEGEALFCRWSKEENGSVLFKYRIPSGYNVSVVAPMGWMLSGEKENEFYFKLK